MSAEHASALRKKLGELRAERGRLEEELFAARRLIRGSLVEQSGLAGGKRRGTPALYLYVPRTHARNRAHYVRQDEAEKVRRDVEAYRRYRGQLRRLRMLGQEIVRTFEALGRSVEVPLG
jgi:hypothetical protein